MKRLLLGAVALLFGAPVFAADLYPYARSVPVELPNNWNGWYAGLNVGAAVNDSQYDINPAGCFVTGCGAGGIPGNAFRRYSAGLSGTDFTGGGQVGYNYHFAPLWVAGFETDFNYNGVRNSDVLSQPLGPPLFGPGTFFHAVSTGLDWFGTVRGRLGVLATPNLLLYGTAGLAYGQASSTTNTSFSFLSDTYAGSASTTRFGWTAGAGAEWLVTRAWSVKAEYLYVDLGRADYASGCISPAAVCNSVTPPFYQTSVQTREHVARVGVNYHFPQY